MEMSRRTRRDGDCLVSLNALGWLADLFVEGRATVFGLDNPSFTDLTLETTGLGAGAVQAEELDVHFFGLGVLIRLRAAWATFDWLGREAQFVVVF